MYGGVDVNITRMGVLGSVSTSRSVDVSCLSVDVVSLSVCVCVYVCRYVCVRERG